MSAGNYGELEAGELLMACLKWWAAIGSNKLLPYKSMGLVFGIFKNKLKIQIIYLQPPKL